MASVHYANVGLCGNIYKVRSLYYNSFVDFQTHNPPVPCEVDGGRWENDAALHQSVVETIRVHG